MSCILSLDQLEIPELVLCYDFFRSLSDLAVNFTVRFKGTGYKEIEPLETSLLSRRMLGSSPVRFVAMEANDGQYVAMVMKVKVLQAFLSKPLILFYRFNLRIFQANNRKEKDSLKDWF